VGIVWRRTGGAARRALVLVLVSAALAACNPLGFFAERVELPCPYARVLAEGETYASFEGDVPDPNRLEIEAGFISLEARCEYDDEDDLSSRMVLDLAVVIGVRRGPAAVGEVDRVPYFVALVGPDRSVVTREEFVAEVPAPPPGQAFALTEPEEIRLTFPAAAPVAPWEYEVIVSFLLTAEQLEFQRLRRR
jgi:hypothetical protein